MTRFSKGFTLVEILVGMFVFSLIAGVTIQVLTYGIRFQRNASFREVAFREGSNAAEYMSRRLRQARPEMSCADPGDPSTCACLTTKGVGASYEVSASDGSVSLTGEGVGIRFPAFAGGMVSCVELKESNGILREVVDGASSDLTGQDVVVQDLSFKILGDTVSDLLQPRSSFTMDVSPAQGVSGFRLQSTISARRFDIPMEYEATP